MVITEVGSNSPFGKAGFEKGDIILQVGNQPIGDADSLFTILSSLKSKQKVTITAVPTTNRPGWNCADDIAVEGSALPVRLRKEQR